MADLLHVAQLGGQVRNTSQDALPQTADAGFQGEGSGQPVGHDLLWLVTGNRTGLVRLAGGDVAFVCAKHGTATRIVSDPENLIADCLVCTAEREADKSGARRRFLEVLSHG